MKNGVLDLRPEHQRLVLDILAANLPPAARVWGFGSRATGRARRFSDLDLAVDAKRRLTLDETAALAEAFDDSDLPYAVDIVDWCAPMGDRFRQAIADQRILLVDHPPSAAVAGADAAPKL